MIHSTKQTKGERWSFIKWRKVDDCPPFRDRGTRSRGRAGSQPTGAPKIAQNHEWLPSMRILTAFLVWYATGQGVADFSFGAGPEHESFQRSTTSLAEFVVQKGGGPLIVPVTIDGTSAGLQWNKQVTYRMLVDTGAEHTCFDVVHRAMLGRPTGAVEVSPTLQIETFSAPRISIGTLKIVPNDDVGCIDLAAVANGLGESIDGLLGMDVLSRLIVSIDFDAGRLRFHRAADRAFGLRIPLTWGDRKRGSAFVRAAVGNSTINFLIDTGGVDTFSGTLEPRSYAQLASARRLVTIRSGNVFTVGGLAETKFARVGSLSLGGFMHERLILGQFSFNCLGLAYLSRYHVAFDFPNRVMYLRPGKAFARADDYDLSFLAVSRARDAVMVANAYHGGAAAKAGVKNGDIIFAIDGQSTRQMSLFVFRRFLHVEGRHVLDVERNGSREQIVLVLKSDEANLQKPPAAAQSSPPGACKGNSLVRCPAARGVQWHEAAR
jgi:hypothetical protein